MLGYFDWQKKDYTRIPIEEQVEVLALVGDIALNDGEPKLHPHVVVSKADGTGHGGHLLEAHVRPTLEVIITESPTHVHRRSDPETGLRSSGCRNTPMVDSIGCRRWGGRR